MNKEKSSAVALRKFDVIVIALVGISVAAIKSLGKPQCQLWALIEQGTCTCQETAVNCTAVMVLQATPYMATRDVSSDCEHAISSLWSLP